MDLLVRGQYVLTDAGERDAGVLTDAAVLVSGSRITAVGDWRALRRANPKARVVGNGKQLPAWLAEVLASRDRAEAAPTFAPEGLYLERVDYDAKWGLPQ